MSKVDLTAGLRAIERDLGPELSRASRLPEPPRQQPENYAPVSYREPDETDPIVKGLLAHLPAPGSVWPKEARKLWLELLGGSFQIIYRETEEAPAAKTDASSQHRTD